MQEGLGNPHAEARSGRGRGGAAAAEEALAEVPLLGERQARAAIADRERDAVVAAADDANGRAGG